MTIQMIRSDQRGEADHGWLQAKHSFSFGEYYDPRRMGFGLLRVINEDRVAPGRGFAMHGHQDMEILTYVLEGALAHRDSLGNASVIRPGDVQRMSAGSGIRHSEVNPDMHQGVHLLQIWLLPHTQGIAPGYAQQAVDRERMKGRLLLLASPEGRDGSVVWHTHASLYAGLFDQGLPGGAGQDDVRVPLPAGRRWYVHLARGALQVQGQTMAAGDALAWVPDAHEVAELVIGQGQQAEVLVFDAGPA